MFVILEALVNSVGPFGDAGGTYLIEPHYFLSIHRLSLIQRHKLYFIRWQRFVCEWSFNSVQVMGAYCNERPLSG